MAIAANELVTVAIGVAANGSIADGVPRDAKDFNALRSSLALFGVDKTCANARLVADKNTVVIAGVAPLTRQEGREPVKVALAVFQRKDRAALSNLASSKRGKIQRPDFRHQGGAGGCWLCVRDGRCAVTRD